MDLNSLEKIIDLTIFIKELVTNFRSRDSYLNTIKAYMDAITQSLTQFKTAYKEGKVKKEGIPLACGLLEESLMKLRSFLEKENSANKIIKFLKGSSLRKSCTEYMNEITKNILSMNLAVSVRNGNEEIMRFDELEKRFDLVDEKLSKIAISKNFQNPISADFWIQNFGEEQIVDSARFLEKFKGFVFTQEKILLDEMQTMNILSLLDEDQQKTVSCQQWDKFFTEIWTYFERKQEIFTKKELILRPVAETLPQLTLIYEETNFDDLKEYDYPIGHVFKITDESYEFVDIAQNKIKNNKNLTKEGLMVGKKKNGVNPDIYFDTHIKTVSGKQFQITAKKYLNVKGYYISDLSTTNFTALKVESHPHALNTGMVFDLNGHVFEVLKVIPEPLDGVKKDYFFIPTSGMENSGEGLIEAMIKQSKKTRASLLIKEKEEAKTEGDPEEDRTFKRVPKTRYNANKQATPTIVVQCLQTPEGPVEGQKPIELTAKSSKGLYLAEVGSNKDCALFINDKDGILPYNCQIVYEPEFKCWVMAEKWPGSKQVDPSAGSLIYLKTAEDFKKGQAGGFACRLRNGMKIFFNCHVFSVNLKE